MNFLELVGRLWSLVGISTLDSGVYWMMIDGCFVVGLDWTDPPLDDCLHTLFAS